MNRHSFPLSLNSFWWKTNLNFLCVSLLLTPLTSIALQCDPCSVNLFQELGNAEPVLAWRKNICSLSLSSSVFFLSKRHDGKISFYFLTITPPLLSRWVKTLVLELGFAPKRDNPVSFAEGHVNKTITLCGLGKKVSRWQRE